MASSCDITGRPITLNLLTDRKLPLPPPAFQLSTSLLASPFNEITFREYFQPPPPPKSAEFFGSTPECKFSDHAIMLSLTNKRMQTNFIYRVVYTCLV